MYLGTRGGVSSRGGVSDSVCAQLFDQFISLLQHLGRDAASKRTSLRSQQCGLPIDTANHRRLCQFRFWIHIGTSSAPPHRRSLQAKLNTTYVNDHSSLLTHSRDKVAACVWTRSSARHIVHGSWTDLLVPDPLRARCADRVH